MPVTNQEMKELIRDRELSQWHLMVASLLGSLASQQGMFNQAFLNRLLTHSMDTFVIPYFESLPEYGQAVDTASASSPLKEKLYPVVHFIDEVFGLAGEVEVIQTDQGHAAIKVGSSTCRFCPIGVGKAEMKPGNTFCPFPKMIEMTANAMLGAGKVSTVLKREGMKTRILEKKDGSCYITYEAH